MVIIISIMASPESAAWHIQHNIDVNRLAFEMNRLFTLGHAAVQSAEYTAVQQQYLQELTTGAWHDYSTDPPVKDHLTCG